MLVVHNTVGYLYNDTIVIGNKFDTGMNAICNRKKGKQGRFQEWETIIICQLNLSSRSCCLFLFRRRLFLSEGDVEGDTGDVDFGF